jgi:hypothetical protein
VQHKQKSKKEKNKAKIRDGVQMRTNAYGGKPKNTTCHTSLARQFGLKRFQFSVISFQIILFR